MAAHKLAIMCPKDLQAWRVPSAFQMPLLAAEIGRSQLHPGIVLLQELRDVSGLG